MTTNENTYKKDLLNSCIDNALRFRAKYICVVVQLPNNKIELIINTRDSFLEKQSYYNYAYDNDLVLKADNDIKIIDFTSANTFSEIEMDLGLEEE